MRAPDTQTREDEGGDSLDDTLLTHVFDTYHWLRVGIAVIAFGFPLWLWAFGKWHGLPLQGSMSAYYWAAIEGDPPVRVWFVGWIFAIGSFLILYKGYSLREDWALNLAALCLIGVALFPMSWNCGYEQGYCAAWRWHSVFAVTFFAFIVFVAIFDRNRTLSEVRDPSRRRLYSRLYLVTSVLLAGSPVPAIIVHLATRRSQLTFWLEAFAIWAFAIYWLIKSRELRSSVAEGKSFLQEARRRLNE